MKKLFTLLLTLSAAAAVAQTSISGVVTDQKNEALPFANISIVGSYDGASANMDGKFSFETEETGEHELLVSLMGFEPLKITLNLSGTPIVQNLKMVESITSLNAVVVTAGMFEASDEKKMVMMKPLDIVTTAGGGADIVSVMQLLPGAGRVGEREGLFVRGGAATETKTLIDGMIVQNPFFSSTPDVPQRGRFSPFMFKGTAFSTGGYSAQYGQALSSVLLLNTMDKQGENSNASFGINMAGLTASYTHKGWLTATANYSNIAPFLAIANTNLDFEKIPQSVGGTIAVNETLKNKATIKAYTTYTNSQSGINLPTFDTESGTYLFKNQNINSFSNASYKTSWKDGLWQMQTGFSTSHNVDKLQIAGTPSNRTDHRTQARAVFSRAFGKSNASTVSFGSEFHDIEVANTYNGYDFGLEDKYSAGFVESEFYVSSKLAVRLGARAEYTTVISKGNVAPRLSAAYKLGKNAQVSLAAGRFYQNPEKEYLYLNKTLDFEQADHVIMNYQLIKNDRTFRTEVFYKKYHHLVAEEVSFFDPNPYRFPIGSLSNTGKGFAQGFDVFFRDQKSIPNGDFWITYSYLDTERQFRNYQTMVQPEFATKHNLSVVYKQFLTGISTNVGVTLTHTSGRPIYGYAEDFKHVEYTKPFENVSLMASHIKQVGGHFLVFYATLDNALGRKNNFGYRYSADGSERYAVKPLMYRTFFFGLSWTIGKLNGRSREAELEF